MVKVTLKDNISNQNFEVEENKTVLELSKKENLQIEGSCNGSMACSTCHIIIDREWVKKIPPPCIDEKETFSLLPNYNENSRLGCQIKAVVLPTNLL